MPPSSAADPARRRRPAPAAGPSRRAGPPGRRPLPPAPCTGRCGGWRAKAPPASAASSHRSPSTRLPVIHVRILFVEHDAGIGPDGRGELVVEAGGEHRPLAAVGEADDADPRRIDLRHAGQGSVTVGSRVGQQGERLPALSDAGLDQQLPRSPGRSSRPSRACRWRA